MLFVIPFVDCPTAGLGYGTFGRGGGNVCGVLMLAELAGDWRFDWRGCCIFTTGCITVMHDYQRGLMFAQSDGGSACGTGFILQARTAIGSGGWLGKDGWMARRRSCQFIPRKSTDFLLGGLLPKNSA